MKLKNKLIFAFILALVVCVLLAPCAFAEEAETDELASGSPQLAEETVEGSQLGAETVVEAEEPAAELTPIEEETEVPEQVDEPEVTEQEPVVEETAEEPAAEEIEAPTEGGAYAAQFYGLNGSVATLAGGEEADLVEIIRALGYEGEIESAESSNPEALEIADGKVRILNPFGDETIKLVIGGEEVTIRVHDPETVNANNIVEKFTVDGGDYILNGDVTINNGVLTVPIGVTVTLDLNGHALIGKAGTTGSVIKVEGNFTLNDSKTDTEHAGYMDANGLWHLDEKNEHVLAEGETKKSIFGGVITGGKSVDGGGVYVGFYKQEYRAWFTMNGGTIAGNSATFGGGVYTMQRYSKFTMTDGEISGNTAASGGGVFVNYYTPFEMTGGAITDNTATDGGGGVALYTGHVEPVFFTIKLGGDAKIIGNSKLADGVRINENLLLHRDTVVKISEHSAPNNMLIGVTRLGGNPDVTKANGEAAKYFSSDNPAYVPVNKEGRVHLAAVDGNTVAVNVDSGELYVMVQDAIEDSKTAPGQTIKMVADSTENVTVGSDKTITLDLNGHVLDGDGAGSVITINANGNLTLNDSLGGGKVTKGVSRDGGGVYNSGTFNMTGGIIADNEVSGNGGGVYNSGTFNMTGGIISHNDAMSGGGIYNNGGTVEITNADSSVSNNLAVENAGGIYSASGNVNVHSATISGNDAGNGGGVYINSGNFTIVYSKIINNTSAGDGAGLYNLGTSCICNSEVSGNSTAYGDGAGLYNLGTSCICNSEVSGNSTLYGDGGGIYLDSKGTIFVGENAKVTGNSASNLYLRDGALVTIGTGADVPAPAKGMRIGVTTEKEPELDGYIPITTNGKRGDERFFRSDTGKYQFIFDGVVKLVNPTPNSSEAVGPASVYVDDELLTEVTDYNWVDGRIVFTAKFLASLEAGEHMLTIVFPGNTVNESFSVSDGAVITAEDSKYLAV